MLRDKIFDFPWYSISRKTICCENAMDQSIISRKMLALPVWRAMLEVTELYSASWETPLLQAIFCLFSLFVLSFSSSADHFASMFRKSNRPIPISSDSFYPKMRVIHLSNAGVRALLANFDHCLQNVLFPTDKYFRREAFIPLAWDSCQQGLLFLAFPKPVRSVVLSYGYSWSLRLLCQGSQAFSNSEKNS